jgi:predicted transcriptional regulator
MINLPAGQSGHFIVSVLQPGVTPMDILKDHPLSRAHDANHTSAHARRERGADFLLVQEIHPPPRIELARERMLLCRLYLGLIRSINEDYGAAFAAQSDSATLRTIGMYVFLRTVMCSPVGASKIASALKLPRVTVVRRLQEMVKLGYVERLGNAYVVTDKVNIPDLKNKLQRRIDMIVEAAKKLTEVGTPPWPADDAASPLK